MNDDNISAFWDALIRGLSNEQPGKTRKKTNPFGFFLFFSLVMAFMLLISCSSSEGEQAKCDRQCAIKLDQQRLQFFEAQAQELKRTRRFKDCNPGGNELPEGTYCRQAACAVDMKDGVERLYFPEGYCRRDEGKTNLMLCDPPSLRTCGDGRCSYLFGEIETGTGIGKTLKAVCD